MENTAESSAPVESYADQILGMWSGGFDAEAKKRLNALYEALLAAMEPGEFETLVAERKKDREEAESHGAIMLGAGDETPNVVWVLDEAERRQVCTTEEVAYLRENFVHENGLSLVL